VTKVLEREFLLLAAGMLRCRFHVVNGDECTIAPHVQYTHGTALGHLMYYVGYADHKAEMRLLLSDITQSTM